MVDSARMREWMQQRGHAASTKRTMRNSVRRFFERMGLSEEQLLKAARDPRRIRRIADRWVDGEKQAGRRPAYALSVWYSVKSFAESAGVPIAYNPALTPEEMEPADIASRRVPTQAELRRLVDILPLRNRAIVLFLCASGVRIGVLGNGGEGGDHSDGLRLESLPDLDLKTGEFKAKPPIVVVPARLSKNRRAYTTAITSEAAGVVEAMLAQRVAGGEELLPKTPLFVPDPRGANRETRTAEGFRTLNRNALSNMLRGALTKTAPRGIHWSAHTLRAWCSSRLESAESQGLISKTRREWFLGHALGSADVRYNLSRPLSAEATEELRSSYARVETFLAVMAPPKEDVLRPLFLTVKEALREKVDPDAKLTAEEMIEAIRKSLGASTAVGEAEGPARPGSRPGEQRSVAARNVGSYLEAGWRFLGAVGTDLVVVEWPSANAGVELAPA